ncbi:MAG: hypothetical protein WD708_05370 [Kiritimatiellia bacterium]
MTTKRKATGTSIQSAIKILEEAAKDKREEVQELFTGNYEHLKDLYKDNEKSLMKTLHNAKDSAVETATDLEKEGVRKARVLGHDVDKNVHEFPWRYIGGSVLTGLLLGIALQRKCDG